MTDNTSPRQERRREPRLRCAEMITFEVKDSSKHWRRIQANLNEISPSGACLEVDKPVPADASVRLVCGDFKVIGTVRHCTFQEMDYVVGVEFGEGQKWSRGRFWPKHLTDPRTSKAPRVGRESK